jgi:7,8-dihydro-6-hydroxymethylpterin-pyrophosphokinase
MEVKTKEVQVSAVRWSTNRLLDLDIVQVEDYSLLLIECFSDRRFSIAKWF